MIEFDPVRHFSHPVGLVPLKVGPSHTSAIASHYYNTQKMFFM